MEMDQERLAAGAEEARHLLPLEQERLATETEETRLLVKAEEEESRLKAERIENERVDVAEEVAM